MYRQAAGQVFRLNVWVGTLELCDILNEDREKILEDRTTLTCLSDASFINIDNGTSWAGHNLNDVIHIFLVP